MLFDGAPTEGWTARVFVYTVDWDGRPVVRDHRAGCCARRSRPPRCSASAQLEQQWWELAERVFIDREDGGWWMACDVENRPSSEVWDGKPDVYHALGANGLSVRAGRR